MQTEPNQCSLLPSFQSAVGGWVANTVQNMQIQSQFGIKSDMASIYMPYKLIFWILMRCRLEYICFYIRVTIFHSQDKNIKPKLCGVQITISLKDLINICIYFIYRNKLIMFYSKFSNFVFKKLRFFLIT